MHTKKSVSKHTSSTAKASANSLPMNSNHSVEYCVGCRGKVKISNITQVEFKGKGTITRRRMVGTCEHGHKWGKFVASKSKTVGNSNNKKMVHTGGSGSSGSIIDEEAYISPAQAQQNKAAQQAQLQAQQAQLQAQQAQQLQAQPPLPPKRFDPKKTMKKGTLPPSKR